MASRRKRAIASAATRTFAALSLLVILAVAACSQPAESPRSPGSATTTPSTTGVTPASPSSSPTVYAAFDPALAAKLQADLEDSSTDLHYPALAAAVILPDGSSWSGAAGMAEVVGSVRATSGTSFAIGSITKTFTAALLLELAHDGMLSLDDPIAKWLPQLADDARFMTDRVTVRNLLGHTSGINDYTSATTFGDAVSKDPARHWTPDELLHFVGDPSFAPGTKWAYSNTNYVLAGMMIEQAAGSTVASLLRERILAPLALEETVLQPQEQPAGPIAHGYSERLPGEAGGQPTDPWDGSGLTPNASWASAAWAAGGMAATAPDLARWAAALYGGRVLDAVSLAEMLDFKSNVGLHGGGVYGLGVQQWLGNGGITIGHAGGIPGFQSAMWYFMRPRATVVMLTNTDVVPIDAAYHSLETIVVAHLGL
jgi:D-alanyl-D-alanine carboxypeptidase